MLRSFRTCRTQRTLQTLSPIPPTSQALRLKGHFDITILLLLLIAVAWAIVLKLPHRTRDQHITCKKASFIEAWDVSVDHDTF